MNPEPKGTLDKKGPTAARTSTRLAVSAPAGLAVLLILGTVVAFGHEGLFPRLPDQATGPSTPPMATATAKPSPTATATPKPTAKPTATPKPTATAAPTPKPEEIAQAEATPKPAATAAPTPKPAPIVTPKPAAPAPPAPPATAALTLSVLPSERADKVQLGWSAYTGAGFSYYKLVRSYDANATWPASGDDEVINAFGNAAETATRDRPQCGVTVFYRVFAVQHTEAGYQVLAPSNTVSAATTCPPPPAPNPATQGIGLTATFADGKVNLAWGACATEGFNAWKIVRSQTNAEPTYPENDGTELIAALGNPGETWFSDGSVASGQTWFYRVLARADVGNGNFIACASQVAAVTIP